MQRSWFRNVLVLVPVEAATNRGDTPAVAYGRGAVEAGLVGWDPLIIVESEVYLGGRKHKMKARYTDVSACKCRG
ncbi:hypothetical protein C8R43DRAFT_970056 [Mycena crocata]|nr:hypothetical protein C8R43DRAFT_970056 [Mycena crocata]